MRASNYTDNMRASNYTDNMRANYTDNMRVSNYTDNMAVIIQCTSVFLKVWSRPQ